MKNMTLSMGPIRKVLARFRTRKIPLLLIAVLLLVAVAFAASWAFGGFLAKKFTYVPNREYRVAEVNKSAPATLEELLHSNAPDIETLLKTPAIAEELTNAKELTDVVDSRTALNNLRTLDRQLSEWLQGLPEVEAEGPAEGQEKRVADLSVPGTLRNVDWGIQTPTVDAASLLQGQSKLVVSLQAATRRLLQVPSYANLQSVPSSINMKGVWQSPDEALIHMVPSGDWIPEQGYKLYRVVNGQEELLKEQLLSPPAVVNNLTVGNADAIKDLFDSAELTPGKLASLGMTAAQFRDLVYRADTLETRARVNGKQDFLRMKETLITIPAGIDQKMPETDRMLHLPIQVMGRQENGQFALAESETALWKSLSLIAIQPKSGIDSLKLTTGGEERFQLVRSVLEARQQLSTLSFVDDEFAEEAGFLFRDDLSRLNLTDGTPISYVLKTPDGSKFTLVLSRGTENELTKPKGLQAYGIDGKVPIRWDQAENPRERAILSGYFIERKLDGEKEFTQINEEPVVATYTLDETGIYFETPVLYEDTVENGRTAEYRIRSIDIFGRASQYSDIGSFRVEKVTPPNAPSINCPVLSDDAEGASQAVVDAISANNGKRGVVLPVFTASPDTVRFTVYRAAAVGARGFGTPKPIADLVYENPAVEAAAEAAVGGAAEGTPGGLQTASPPSMIQLKQSVPATIARKRLNKAVQLLLTNLSNQHPDLIYFDADIQEGVTYKYWVSAWDSWNNESAWSPSVSAAVRTDREPEVPKSLRISMSARELPDYSSEPPGLYHDNLVTAEQLAGAHNFPMRPLPVDATSDIILEAETIGVQIGEFFPSGNLGANSFVDSLGLSLSPAVIDGMFDNLPGDRYVHMFVAVRGEDVLPDGTARLKWPAYSGSGLRGYSLYRPNFPALPLDQMQGMTRDELMELGRWSRVNGKVITHNQYVVGGLNRTPGSVSLFLVCVEPQGSSMGSFIGDLELTMEYFHSVMQFIPGGGFVYVRWDAVPDPQVDYYRVYRSEVPSFKKPVDESALEWTMVGDHIRTVTYSERVEQSFAHYYYYKVTSVSPWGVESQVGTVQKFRVPSTKPPETPNLLLPLSRKDGVQVNFSAVSHCDRYEIYRAEIPVVGESELNDMMTELPETFGALFNSQTAIDSFISNVLGQGLLPISLPHSSSSSPPPSFSFTSSLPPSPSSSIGVNTPLNPLSKLKTILQARPSNLASNLSGVSAAKKLSAYKSILDRLGPLAVADYYDLSEGMLRRVRWTKVGEMPADYDTVEASDPSTGLLKPLSIIDTSARYGVTYLYTVQAWNDDNLGSNRPEPVEGTPRRNRAFDPISGLAGEIKDDKPRLTWNAPTMPNLTAEQCRQDTVGYIVYRADKKDGTYYQASPMVFTTSWTDGKADPHATNWYKVKVLDTGGYLSEFGEPVLVQRLFAPRMTTVIPDFDSKITPPDVEIIQVAPKITVSSATFQVTEGTQFRTQYNLTGTEPVTVTVTARRGDGTLVAGFSADATSKTVSGPSNLGIGVYNVTVKAKNTVGESSAGFSLEVKSKTGPAVPPQITLQGTEFVVEQGTAFQTTYGLTGTEPITVTVEAKTADGAFVAGFSLDAASKTITAPRGLRTGVYTVTVKAKNTAGESSKAFSLKVQQGATPGVAPKIAVDGTEFIVDQGTAFETVYELTGTEPITVVVSATSRTGAPVAGFTVDAAAHLIKGPKDLNPGVYNVTATASNSAGSGTVSFTLEVRPVRTPPKLGTRPDGYSFTMTSGTDFSTKIRATGSEPFTWSLARVGGRVQFPSVADISEDGTLTINGDIAAGSYGFVIKVANDVGSDSRTAELEVKPAPKDPIRPPIKPPIRPPIIKPTGVSWDGQGTEVVLVGAPGSPSVSGQTPSTITQGSTELYQKDRVMCMTFTLTDVRLSRKPIASIPFSGTAMLNTGYSEPIPVKVGGAFFTDGNLPEMTAGSVYISEPRELDGIGVTLTSMEISPATGKSVVSGHVRSTVAAQNLVGDLYALSFTDAKLTNSHIILKRDPASIVTIPVLREIRYEKFTFHNITEAWIRLNGNGPGVKDFITLVSGVSMKSHLETLNNEGLEFDLGFPARFDLQGRMNAQLLTATDQFLQLLVPGGSGIRVETAQLTYVDGKVQPGGRLVGRLIVPFEKHDNYGPFVPGVYAGAHPETSDMDALATSGAVPSALLGALHDALVQFGETVQQNGLLIVPDDFDMQDRCSYVSLDIYDWTGDGFTMESSYMVPARVSERSLSADLQRKQAIVVSPSEVTVDLDREKFLPRGEGTQTPNETQEPFWVGLVMQGGNVMLPPSFIQTKDGKPITFDLAAGEMIYDLNGFNYQTFLYNDDGVPAKFGKELGGFDDVLVFDCLLDLYANKVNLEVNAKVAVELFRKERVDVKLYTNKEDNEDGDAGQWLCSVAPTKVEDAIADGIDVKIDAGWVKPEGMHLAGALELPEPDTDGFEIRAGEGLGFTDMIVPRRLDDVIRSNNPQLKYAAFALDKPTNIDFQGFTMEVRALDMDYMPSEVGNPVRITMHGSTLLAENIPLSADTRDKVIIDCVTTVVGPNGPVRKQRVRYGESKSVLTATFDDCVDVSGVLVPKLVQTAGSGAVEFDTSQLKLTYLKQLESLPVTTATRFGFDKELGRCYFAVGMTPKGSSISFGGGEIKNFTGLVSYNMEVARDSQRRFQFPDSPGQVAGFIQGLSIYKGSAPSFAAGIKGTLVVARMCEIRDFYFGFETGPTVNAGGEVYLPLDVAAILYGGGSYTKVGSAQITYSHPSRYFSFSMTIDGIDVVVAKVSGSFGFEYSPTLFGVQVGYPETLAGNIAVFRVGVGLAFRIDEDGKSFVRAKVELGLDEDVRVSIVYLHGYLYAGADGAYYFGEDADRLTLELYLKGGLEGGIKVKNKRFNIISFYLDARGLLESTSPFDSWMLEASCKVSYSLDLWLFEVEGSVNASFDTRIG